MELAANCRRGFGKVRAAKTGRGLIARHLAALSPAYQCSPIFSSVGFFARRGVLLMVSRRCRCAHTVSSWTVTQGTGRWRDSAGVAFFPLIRSPWTPVVSVPRGNYGGRGEFNKARINVSLLANSVVSLYEIRSAIRFLYPETTGDEPRPR